MYRLMKVLAAATLMLQLHQQARAAEDDLPPGVQALEEFRFGTKRLNPVQNRFFLKGKRFELAPMVGLAPNNPFASRFFVGLAFGYHFNENLSIQGNFNYAPDLGTSDVKSLVPLLVDRAYNNEAEPVFRQPFEKVTFSGNLGVEWAPVYGKINVLGETVLNFDFYGFLGVGIVLQNEYQARRDTSYQEGPIINSIQIDPTGTELRFAPTIGLGARFFLTQLIALRLDGRFLLYIDDQPDYTTDGTGVADQPLRLVTLFNVGVGVSIFIPKMKPRLYDF